MNMAVVKANFSLHMVGVLCTEWYHDIRNDVGIVVTYLGAQYTAAMVYRGVLCKKIGIPAKYCVRISGFLNVRFGRYRSD